VNSAWVGLYNENLIVFYGNVTDFLKFLNHYVEYTPGIHGGDI
jgi:hypothetical protein